MLLQPATPHSQRLLSQYDIPPKRQPPKVQAKLRQPEHVYESLDDDRSVSAPVRPVALPRCWMKKSSDQQVLGERMLTTVESRNSKKVKTKGE